MYPSSTTCRTQEAYQRNRATHAVLENVRIVASKAAVAWGKEALLAEKREKRQRDRRAIADAISEQDQHIHSGDDRSLSENPDRGFAGAPRP